MRRSAVYIVVLAVLLSGCPDRDEPVPDVPSPPTSAPPPGVPTVTEVDTKTLTSPPSSGVTVTAKVSRGVHVGTGLEGPDTTYEVAVEITNNGDEELTFEKVVGAFLPPEPKTPLQMPTSQNDDTPFRLPPGESLEVPYTSDGYTSRLIADAGSASLIFAVALVTDEEAIGPRTPL